MVRLGFLLLLIAVLPAVTKGAEVLPPVFGKATPSSVDDLKAIERHVKSILPRLSRAVVCVQVGPASGSGVVVSDDGVVLTAGHVCGQTNLDVQFIFSDGSTARGKTLGINNLLDAGMMKISNAGPWPHAEVGDLGESHLGDWVLTMGHPGGFDSERSVVVRLGRIIRLTPDMVQTDCTLNAGDSGGPLFDMRGQVIGIHSRISDSAAENFHVPITTYRVTWDRLRKGESWGDERSSPSAWFGARGLADPAGCRLTSVPEDSPAYRAGLRVGDIVEKVNGLDISDYETLRRVVTTFQPGDELKVELQRDEKEMSITVKLGGASTKASLTHHMTDLKSEIRNLKSETNSNPVSELVATLLFVIWLSSSLAGAQDFSDSPSRLSTLKFKNGEATLRAFEPISKATRYSVAKIDLNGVTVALATVIDSSGLALTKASEIREGKLTCWLASGKEAPVERIRVDEENDLALIKIKAKGLKPIQWAAGTASLGQWVVTPGIAETPQAVGIISAPRRKIPPKRALIGVRLDSEVRGARIDFIMEGLGAQKAGLHAGDRILALNGSNVETREELIEKLRNFREGQTVKLHVQREKEEFDASVKMMLPTPELTGRGFDREDRMNRMGSEPSERAEGFELALQHDTVLQNWQCGGPLVNLDGKAVGLNIARAGRVASYALPADLVQRALTKLKQPVQTK